MVEDTNIRMTVRTEGLTQRNVNTHVIFSDNRNDPEQPEGRPQDYVSTVDRNGKVLWESSAENGKDTVEILEVARKRDGGAYLMKEKRVTPQKGKLMAHIKDERIEGEESYEVRFKVQGNEFVVDPKLKMKTD